MNQQHTFQPILINFNVPNHLKYKLDRVSKLKGISRTSILNRLIEDFVRDETGRIEDDARIYEMMSKLENTIERNVLKSKPKPNKKPKPQYNSWEQSFIDDSN